MLMQTLMLSILALSFNMKMMSCIKMIIIMMSFKMLVNYKLYDI